MRNIIVVPYDPRWPEMFRAEAEAIQAVFGETCLSIEHIGSTSVPGLRAKPIIDIMPVVRDIEMVAQFNTAMMALGYEPLGENGIPRRRYFRKGGDEERSHHVHVYALANPEIVRHISFREYLIAHPAAAQEYGRIKTEMARRFPHDAEAYMAGKDGFIKETLANALEWYAGLERHNERPE